MAQEVTKLLQELQRNGQTGLMILLLILVVLVVAGLWMYILQKRFIALAVETQKLIDAKVGAADSLREESRKSQEFSAADISQRIVALTTINDELRKEVERLAVQQKTLAESQAAFRQSVKDSITVGLEDIRDRMASVSVTQILEQIPEVFKEDLQSTLLEATRKVIAETTEMLRRSPSDIINIEELASQIQYRLRQVMEEFPLPWMPGDPRDWRHRDYREYYERHIDMLAERIAYHMRRRF